MKKDPIGKILASRGIITGEQLTEAINYKDEKGIKLGDALLRLNMVTETDLGEALSKHFNMPFLQQIDLEKIDMNLVSRIPMDYLRRNHIMPLKIENGECHIAVADPRNLESLDDLRTLINGRITPVLALEKEIMRTLNNCYNQPCKHDSVTTHP